MELWRTTIPDFQTWHATRGQLAVADRLCPMAATTMKYPRVKLRKDDKICRSRIWQHKLARSILTHDRSNAVALPGARPDRRRRHGCRLPRYLGERSEEHT